MSRINNFIGGLLRVATCCAWVLAASGSATAQALPPVPPISDSLDRTLYQMHRDQLVDDQYHARVDELMGRRRLESDRCQAAEQNDIDMGRYNACMDHVIVTYNAAEAALNRWREAEHARSFNARWQR